MEQRQSFSTSAVARYCHVTSDTIRKWSEAGRLPVFKTPGGHRRIHRKDLLKFLRMNGLPIHEELSNIHAKVLVIGGDDATVTAIRGFVERGPKPSIVVSATDSLDAGYQIASFQPGIVFIDLDSPGLDGATVCRRIAALPNQGDMRIVAVMTPDPATPDSRLEGSFAYIHKPIQPDELRRVFARMGVEINQAQG